MGGVIDIILYLFNIKIVFEEHSVYLLYKMSQDFNHEYQTMKEKKLTLTPTQQK
jgi:hypothetical protein